VPRLVNLWNAQQKSVKSVEAIRRDAVLLQKSEPLLFRQALLDRMGALFPDGCVVSKLCGWPLMWPRVCEPSFGGSRKPDGIGSSTFD